MDGKRVEELGDGDGEGVIVEECEGEECENGYVRRVSCCLEAHCWGFDSLREERRICKQVFSKMSGKWKLQMSELESAGMRSRRGSRLTVRVDV